jgi:hypothetical protein
VRRLRVDHIRPFPCGLPLCRMLDLASQPNERRTSSRSDTKLATRTSSVAAVLS